MATLNVALLIGFLLLFLPITLAFQVPLTLRVLLDGTSVLDGTWNSQQPWRLVSSTPTPTRGSSSRRHQSSTNNDGVVVPEEKDTAETKDLDDRDHRLSTLKRNLLQIGASYDRGYGASPSARNRAEYLIDELELLNRPVHASRGIEGDDDDVSSPLAGRWRMIWTTAPDVLVLGASPVATVGAIYQIFEPPLVTNVIDFLPRAQALFPPSLLPSSLLRVKVQTRASYRTGFPNRVGLWFESVQVQPIEFWGFDASQWPPFATNLPKLPGTTDNNGNNTSGPGYFDVTYLDEELLIIRQNQPGGLFALVKVEDSEP
jgi:hypothetical protein